VKDEQLKRLVKNLAFAGFTSFVCEVMALIFFFWCDWRILVGYLFIHLGEFNMSSAFQSCKVANEISKEIADEKTKKDDQ